MEGLNIGAVCIVLSSNKSYESSKVLPEYTGCNSQHDAREKTHCWEYV